MRMLQPVPATSFRRQPWANGGGHTTELAAGPDRDDWRWRISLAEVNGDSTFSVLPGVRRQIAPLDGTMELRFDGDPAQTLQRLQVLAFDGGRDTACHLPDGAGRDFNLMLRNGAAGTLVLRPLLDSMVLLPRPGSRWFVFVVAGTCTLDAETQQLELGTGDAAWVRPPVSSRVHITGGGELALVRLDTPPLL